MNHAVKTIDASYKAKPEGYFSLARTDILPVLSGKFADCLDVGCGAGYTGAWLKHEGFCRSVTGIEFVELAAKEASGILDRAICADVEAFDFSNLPKYDLILCLDVLEHLRDPWTTLRAIVSRLNPQGTLITSLPNIQHIFTSLPLLFGRFDYTDQGTLDRTHLRFFTRRTAIELLESAGLKISKIHNSFPRSWLPIYYGTLTLLRGLFVRQYVIAANREGV